MRHQSYPKATCKRRIRLLGSSLEQNEPKLEFGAPNLGKSVFICVHRWFSPA
jgi:hypothetical protein